MQNLQLQIITDQNMLEKIKTSEPKIIELRKLR